MLLEMNPLITPEPGLFIWSVLIFLIFFLLLRKLAWKPITEALAKREESIANALQEAEKARQEMAKLKADNEKLLNEAKLEREKILKEAREMKESIIEEARQNAKIEGDRMIQKAKEVIEAEKNMALQQVKHQVAVLSVEIAEKIIRKKFENPAEQQAIASQYLKDINLN
ncbi:MAG: F0F1 ATP synthase subunit B [Bacteroidia bacterium]|nr:F0F1 ATP synthase subunit B [Bacteroidia bacterium]MDW8345836.1 F0F1 ATP synthase subunit B [Bacteroidia bacterium]